MVLFDEVCSVQRSRKPTAVDRNVRFVALFSHFFCETYFSRLRWPLSSSVFRFDTPITCAQKIPLR
jgi:hypothetical protein